MRTTLCILLLSGPGLAQASDPGPWSAEVHVAEKYDDNLDLSAQEAASGEARADFVTEVGLGGRGAWDWRRWSLDAGLRLAGDLPAGQPEHPRLYLSRDLDVGVRFSKNHALSLSDQGDCFMEVGTEAFDLCRTYLTVGWLWTLAERWQLHLGQEFQDTSYFSAKGRNYSGSGLFLEVRMPWSHRFEAWLRGAGIGYIGALHARTKKGKGGPHGGGRLTTDLGVDWMLGGGVSLLLTGQYQWDEAESELRQFDRTHLPDHVLEADAQFNFHKVRGTLLVTWRANETFTFGGYGEVVHLDFLPAKGLPDRVDLRWMASGWLRAALTDSGLGAKLRYLFRRNHSTVEAESFQNQIIYLGLEQRW